MAFLLSASALRRHVVNLLKNKALHPLNPIRSAPLPVINTTYVHSSDSGSKEGGKKDEAAGYHQNPGWFSMERMELRDDVPHERGETLVFRNPQQSCSLREDSTEHDEEEEDLVESILNFKQCDIMPSLQTALPPELANNALRLYRECLRRAQYVGQRQYNTELVVDMVRQQFKKNMHEKDPEKIQKMKDDAARGLINHMLLESEKLSGRKFSSSA